MQDRRWHSYSSYSYYLDAGANAVAKGHTDVARAIGRWRDAWFRAAVAARKAAEDHRAAKKV